MTVTCEHGVIGHCPECTLVDPGELGEQPPKLVHSRVDKKQECRYPKCMTTNTDCVPGCVSPSRVTNAQSDEPIRKEPVSDFVKKLRRQADAVYLACEQDVAHDISNSLKIAADLLSLPADARSSRSFREGDK